MSHLDWHAFIKQTADYLTRLKGDLIKNGQNYEVIQKIQTVLENLLQNLPSPESIGNNTIQGLQSIQAIIMPALREASTKISQLALFAQDELVAAASSGTTFLDQMYVYFRNYFAKMQDGVLNNSYFSLVLDKLKAKAVSTGATLVDSLPAEPQVQQALFLLGIGTIFTIGATACGVRYNRKRRAVDIASNNKAIRLNEEAEGQLRADEVSSAQESDAGLTSPQSTQAGVEAQAPTTALAISETENGQPAELSEMPNINEGETRQSLENHVDGIAASPVEHNEDEDELEADNDDAQHLAATQILSDREEELGTSDEEDVSSQEPSKEPTDENQSEASEDDNEDEYASCENDDEEKPSSSKPIPSSKTTKRGIIQIYDDDDDDEVQYVATTVLNRTRISA